MPARDAEGHRVSRRSVRRRNPRDRPRFESERPKLTNVVEQDLYHVEVPVLLPALVLRRLLEQLPRVPDLDFEFVRRCRGR